MSTDILLSSILFIKKSKKSLDSTCTHILQTSKAVCQRLVLWEPTYGQQGHGKPKSSFVDTLRTDTGAANAQDIASHVRQICTARHRGSYQKCGKPVHLWASRAINTTAPDNGHSTDRTTHSQTHPLIALLIRTPVGEDVQQIVYGLKLLGSLCFMEWFSRKHLTCLQKIT